MDFVVGTSAGAFWGASGRSGGGIGERGVRHLERAGDRLFAGASDGVYMSDDDRSWKRSGVDGGEVWNVAGAAFDDHTLYASTCPAHLFVSHDTGDSWDEVASFLEAPGAERWCVPNSPIGARALALAFDPFDAQRLWVGVEVGVVVASQDAGV